ncbi:MAG: hypothetical protein WBP72_03140 [Rhodocyclaceae bacterium]
MTDSSLTAVDFSDAQQCLSVLARLPLTKINQVHETLGVLLGGILSSPPPPSDCLEVLETARVSLAFVQEEMANRYAQSALPPESVEDETLRRVVTLWQAMARAYSQVAQLGGGSEEVQRRLALICQRCIHYSGNAIQEYFRARRDVPKGLWSELHGYYATAEEWGIAQMEVAEPMAPSRPKQSCAQSYIAVLLVDLGHPYGRSGRDFSLLLRWSERFAAFADLLPADRTSDERAYGVDLLLDNGPRPLGMLAEAPASHDSLRRLVASRLADEIRELLNQIKRRVPPAQLGLGSDCLEPACSRLLLSLYRPWCLAASPRRFQRRKASGAAQLSYGFEAIHYYIAQAEFVQPEHARTYAPRELESLMTFRHQVDTAQQLHIRAAQFGYTVENWAIADESVGGFRLLRFGAGVRIEHGQLLGLHPPDGGRFLLCHVSWLMYLASGALMIGVYVLPGAPQAVAARQTGVSVGPTEKYSRAFLLPALPALKQPTTLVLPKGWFKADRIVEVFTDRRIEVRLVAAPTLGTDFDRVSFTPLTGAD